MRESLKNIVIGLVSSTVFVGGIGALVYYKLMAPLVVLVVWCFLSYHIGKLVIDIWNTQRKKYLEKHNRLVKLLRILTDKGV